MNWIKKYRWILIISAVLIIAGLALLLNRRNQAANAQNGDIGETAQAFIGDLAQSATASGQVEAQRQATLSLAASGIVDQVLVSVGDSVNQGDPLVQLQAETLARNVQSAQQGITIAEANLAKATAAPSAAALASAQAQLASAQLKLNGLQNGPSQQEIAASQAAVDAAQANLWSASGTIQSAQTVSEADILAAQAELEDALEVQSTAHNRWVNLADCRTNADGTHTCTPKEENQRMEAATEEVQRANAQVAVAQARLDELQNPDRNRVASTQAGYASALAQFNAAQARHQALLSGGSAAEIAAAQADLASAQASLDSLLSGPSETDLKIYQIQLEQARIALQESLLALEEATLEAPFSAVVTAVYVDPGETASGAAVELVDNDSLEVVLNVDEIDVGQISVGQPAVITLETWPDQEIEAMVTAIAPTSGSSNSGTVTYDVHLAFGPTDLPVLVGMTANADLITEVGQDVLLVPNSALNIDRQNGTYSVNVVGQAADGSRDVSVVEVTIGLRDSDYTQITSGLVQGDTVILGEFTAPTINFGGPPQGGRR